MEDPETASQMTEIIPSISDKDVSEISEKAEKSAGKRTKETEMGRKKILKMIGNVSSKIDSLCGKVPENVNSEKKLGRKTWPRRLEQQG